MTTHMQTFKTRCVMGLLTTVEQMLTSQETSLAIASPNQIDSDGDLPLAEAAFAGQFAVVELLCKYGADVTKTDINGKSIVHRAAESGQVDIIDWVINVKEGGNKNLLSWEDKFGSQPAHDAAYAGQLKALQYLASKGVNLDAKNNEGNTCLAIAKEHHKPKCVEFLESWKKSPKEFVDDPAETDPTASKFDWSDCVLPLVSACENGEIERAIRLLRERAINPNQRTDPAREVLPTGKLGRKFPLGAAASNGKLQLVKLLIESGAGGDVKFVDELGRNAAHLAAANGHVDILEYLFERCSLETKIDMNTADLGGSLPAHTAATNNQLAVLEYLASLGFNFDDAKNLFENVSPLDIARKNNFTKCVNFLENQWKTEKEEWLGKKKTFNWSKSCISLLNDACSMGDEERVFRLLNEKRLNPNQLDEEGDHPVVVAARDGHVAILKILHDFVLEDLWSCKDSEQNTVFHAAASESHLEVVQYLMDVLKCPSIILNECNKNGETCSHIAATNGYLKYLEFVAARGADLDVANEKAQGDTPMMKAQERHRKKCIEFLQKWKRNPSQFVVTTNAAPPLQQQKQIRVAPQIVTPLPTTFTPTSAAVVNNNHNNKPATTSVAASPEKQLPQQQQQRPVVISNTVQQQHHQTTYSPVSKFPPQQQHVDPNDSTATVASLRAEVASLQRQLAQQKSEYEARIEKLEKDVSVSGGARSAFVKDKHYQIDLVGNGLENNSSLLLLPCPASITIPLFAEAKNLFRRLGTFSPRPMPVSGFTLERVDVITTVDHSRFEERVRKLQQSIRSQGPSPFFFPPTSGTTYSTEQLQLLIALRDLFLPRPSSAPEKAPNLMNVFHINNGNGVVIKGENIVDKLRRDQVAQIDQNGSFGKGVYVTPNLEFAARSSSGEFDTRHGPYEPRTEDGGCFPVVWCVTAVGISYPISPDIDYNAGKTEDQDGAPVSDFYQTPLKNGYDTHCAAVSEGAGFQAVPRKEMQYLQLVVEQESQVLPIAVMWMKPV